MNKPSVYLTSLAFLVSEIGVITRLIQMVSILRAKLWKVVLKCKNNVFELSAPFSQNANF